MAATPPLAALVADALRPAEPHAHKHGPTPPEGIEALTHERWPGHSRLLAHGYRRIEALFGAETWKARFRNLRQTYETPEAISGGSAAPMLAHARALPGLDGGSLDLRLAAAVLRRFAWIDGCRPTCPTPIAAA